MNADLCWMSAWDLARAIARRTISPVEVVDAVLARLRWSVAFTLSCCLPGKQLSEAHDVLAAGEDPHVLSSGRRFQVLAPRA